MSVHITQPSGRRTPDLSTAQPRRRDGIAMAISLMAVVLIGAMVAGASYFAMQNSRASDNSRKVVQATNYAEAATAQVLNTWQAAVYNQMAIGATTTIPLTYYSPNKGPYQGSVTKMSSQTFMIDLTAFDSAGSQSRGTGARQRLATLTRIVPLQLPTSAALTIANPVIFGGGNSIVAGADQVPAGWTNNCPTAGAAVVGVRAKAPGDIVGSAGQYTGSPASLITPGLDSMAYTQFGGVSYYQLAANAVQVDPGAYSPGPIVNAGVCVKTGAGTNLNWGDGANPTAACGSYFPVVHIRGGAGTTSTLSSGQGQGMLLVDGDLVVSGTWTYYGILIVRGTFKTTGVGAPKVYGTVLANHVDFSSTSAGNAAAVINYSNCSVSRATNATALSSPMRSRGYVRML